LHENPHVFCWPVEQNFLICSETKALKEQLMPKNVRYILSQLHLCKLVFGSVLLKMNVHSRTVTLYYISLSTVKSKLNMFVLCITRGLPHYLMLKGKD